MGITSGISRFKADWLISLSVHPYGTVCQHGLRELAPVPWVATTASGSTSWTCCPAGVLHHGSRLLDFARLDRCISCFFLLRAKSNTRFRHSPSTGRPELRGTIMLLGRIPCEFGQNPGFSHQPSLPSPSTIAELRSRWQMAVLPKTALAQRPLGTITGQRLPDPELDRVRENSISSTT